MGGGGWEVRGGGGQRAALKVKQGMKNKGEEINRKTFPCFFISFI